MLKDRRTYEIMRPEDVGVPQATLVLGKHSGRHAVQRRCEQIGFTLERHVLEPVYRAVIAHADREKIVSDRDLADVIVTKALAARQAPPATVPPAIAGGSHDSCRSRLRARRLAVRFRTARTFQDRTARSGSVASRAHSRYARALPASPTSVITHTLRIFASHERFAFCCCPAMASGPKSSPAARLVLERSPRCSAISSTCRSRHWRRGASPRSAAAARRHARRCAQADAILLGAVGDPEFDKPSTRVATARNRAAAVRRELELYANLRPARVWPGLEDVGPAEASRCSPAPTCSSCAS